MRPWYLGNTTVRSPFRLREGLVALSTSSLQGNLHGKDQEIAFRNLLGEKGIVSLGTDKTNSVGRKWRSALNKMGFLYPEIPESAGISQADFGALDTITPNGWRLVRAETVPAMQECFLRALSAAYIPSALDDKYEFSVFSPLRHTLAVMLELEKKTGENFLNFIEMGVVVQLTSSDDVLDDIVGRVLDLRAKRLASGSVKKFDAAQRDDAAKLHDYAESTFHDYADANFRYLKATGLVQSKGRGLSIIPEKKIFIERLVHDSGIPDSDKSFYVTLCNGATLPTDHKESALVVLEDLLNQLAKLKIPYSLTGKSTETPADIAVIRHDIEKILSEYHEESYAVRQAGEWEEIAGYMQLLATRKKSMKLSNEEEIEIPQAEAPAYFEWVLWRAFLAINSLANKPYDARRFKIDQDFLPVGTAPGGGPDLIFEFADFVIVVEVTLTESSRQESAEGEPVRRHVADWVSKYEKPVYGLFIANKIDSNTAETFRIGVWYLKDDSKLRLDIVPVTLMQFKAFFEALFKTGRIDAAHIRELLDLSGKLRDEHHAPAWKTEIDGLVKKQIAALHAH